MNWEEPFLQHIISLAQDYFKKLLIFIEKENRHLKLESTLRLLMTQFSLSFSMFTFFHNDIFEKQFKLFLTIIRNHKFSLSVRRDAMVYFSDIMLIARNATFEMEIKLQAHYTNEVEKKRESEQKRADSALRKTINRQSMLPEHKRDPFRDSLPHSRPSQAAVS